MTAKSEEIRHLIASELLQQAEAKLLTWLKDEPRNAEAQTLMVQVELLSMREAEAAERLAQIEDRGLAGDLTQALADHLYCRRQLVSKFGLASDPVGDRIERALGQIGEITPRAGIGIGLTACLIVKNEEAHLDRCLSSLQGIVDEIVVVDTGSTDGTLAIAERHGAKIGHYAWNHHFADARNASLELASQPWILWIDADEVWAKGGETMLREALTRPHFGGYLVKIINFLENQGERSEFVHAPVRLFRNHPTVRFEGRIHEQIAPGLIELGWPVASLPAVQLLHYGYLPETMQDRNKIQRTLDLLQMELNDEPDHPFHLFNLAMTHSVAKNWEACEAAAKRCTEVLPPVQSIGPNAYHLWAVSLLAQDRPEEVLAVAEAAERAQQHCVLTEFERAQALVALKRWPEAELSCRRCVSMEWPDRLTGDTSVLTVKRHLLLGRVLLAQDKHNDLERALEPVRPLPDARAIWGQSLLKRNLPREAAETFEQLFTDQKWRQWAQLYAGQAWMEAGQPARAAALCRERWEAGARDEEGFLLWVLAAERLGDSTEILTAYERYAESCPPVAETLTNWGRAFVAGGEVDRALTCFTEAHKLDPGDPNPLLNAGDTLYGAGRFLDAALCYEQALRLDMENSQAWFVLGNALFQLGALDGAADAFDQCLAREPGHTAAYHNKGLIEEVRAGTLAA